MIVIEYVDGSDRFTLNGRIYPQIYQAKYMGENSISIHNVFDTGFTLIGSTPIGDITFNGTIYTTQAALIGALIPVLYNKNITVNEGGSVVYGTIAGTAAEGNDSRIINGLTAFNWGDHSTQGYLTSLPVHTHNWDSITEKPAFNTPQWDEAYSWGDHSIIGYLTALPPHTHTVSEITDFPSIPDSTSDLTNDSGFITGLSWGEVTGKPTEFNPTAHTHIWGDITEKPVFYDSWNILANGGTSNPVRNTDFVSFVGSGKVKVTHTSTYLETTTHEIALSLEPIAWGEITDKPLEFTPAAHTHTKADITDFAHTHTPSEAGLGNVDNTSDANKPVSSAQQTALNNKLDKQTTVQSFWRGTQADYDAIATKVSTTIYFIEG